MKGGVRETRVWSLPEGCLSEILCRTTPRDVCRLSATSPAFYAAAQSDSVWSAFLPSDVDEVIASAADRLGSLSRRDLFFRLCRSPILLLNSMSFSLHKESWRKCYMIPSTMLFDTIGRTPNEWKRAQFWKSGPPSLYCPRTNSMSVFPCGSRIGLIQGKIKASLLSPSTTYSAYLIFELQERSSDYYPVSVAVNYVKTGKHEMKLYNRAYLTAEAPLVVPMPNCWNFPLYRDDGWMEVRMGEFYNDGVDDGDDNEVALVLKSYKALVSTLHVLGVELRPTDFFENGFIGKKKRNLSGNYSLERDKFAADGAFAAEQRGVDGVFKMRDFYVAKELLKVIRGRWYRGWRFGRTKGSSLSYNTGKKLSLFWSII